MALLKQSTAYSRAFLMVLSSDHVTAATGKTVTVNLSKAAAAFGAAAGAVTEISSGWYKVALSTTDSNTLGDLAYDCTASGCDNTDFCDQVIAVDFADTVRAGLTALPNAAAAASSGLPVLGTNATAISFTAGMTISNASGDALALTSSGSNGNALAAAGNGTGAGIKATAGATGNGLQVVGGATSGSAIKASGTAGNAIALELVGQGSAAALSATGGATGIGITAVGGATSGSGFKCTGTAGNAIALEIVGQGSAAGIQSTGGATGSAFKLVGGGTSGHGLAVTTTSGDGFNLTPTAGNAITATANGTSKHGIVATGGTGGTSDGASLVAGTGGVDLRANQTGNITGNLSGTVTTVTTTTTATNLTNAPTSGDLTSTMKTSVENAVWDAARSSHLATGVFGQLGQEILRDNTATAGAAGTITLDAGASTTVDQYKGDVLYIYSGTGSGQSRVISAYSSGRVATVVPAWVTTPDNTSKFILTAQRTPLVGTDTRIITSADSISSGETVAAVTGAVGSVTGAVGSVTGAVGSVTGAVGSVTGNVGGNVVGSVASVTARVTANSDQWAGTTIPAPAVTGVPKVDLVDIAGATVSTSTAQLGVNAVQIGASVPGSATIGTVTTTTTATNLTNAPTAGDFTATMKTSLNAATPASITGAVGSVTAAVTLSTNDSPVVQSGTAQAGAGSSITLSSGADATNSTYNGQTVKTTGGTGAGQVRVITGYVGATSVATVDRAWQTNPDLTTTYAVLATDSPKTNSSLEVVSASVTGAVGSVTADVGITQAGADKVWSTTVRTLSAAGVQAIWDALTSALTTVNSIGKLLVTNIDATISSRSTYAGADTSGTTTLLSRLTSTRAGNLDNLDVASSTLSVFDAGSDTVTVGTNNDKTGYRLSATGIDDVWDEATAGHASAGTTGKALIDAGASGSDPWDTALPGSYGAGTAGAIVGTNLDAAVSSRSSHSATDVWAVGTRTLTAFAIAVDITSAAVSSIWDKLLSGITTASTIGKLIKDNLDVAISTRSTYAGGDTSGTTTLLGRLTSTRAGNLDNLDAAVTTRLATSGYTAPDNADVVLIKAKTDLLNFTGADVKATLDGETVTASSVTDKTGYALTSAYDAAKTAAQAGDAMTLTSGERDDTAAAALKLDWAGVTGAASRSTMNALRFLRNKWSFTGLTLTVTEEDDTTPAWTGDVTVSASADPITSLDPS